FSRDWSSDVCSSDLAKTVVLSDTSPPSVDHGRPFAFRAHPILPVIGIGKTAARPSQIGDVQFLQGCDDIIAHPFGIGNGTFLPYIDAPVDTTAQMFGKMPRDVFTVGHWVLRLGNRNGVLCPEA